MPAAIFLDSGGVINDNKLRAPQWVRYLGEFFPTTILGGTAEIWGQANQQSFGTFFARWEEYMIQATELAAVAQAQAQATDNGSSNARSQNVYWIFERIQLLAWIKAMIEVAADKVPGLAEKVMPELTDNDLFELARAAHLYTITRVKADFPGAVETIRTLGRLRRGSEVENDKKMPFKLCTSSGDSIEDLQEILGGLGVLDCFDELYGSDRVLCLKRSPLFYERIFADVGIRVKSRDVTPQEKENKEEEEYEEIVVVDDSIKALKWARAQGARTVLISNKGDLDLSLECYSHIDYQLKTLADLPALLESWRMQLEP